MARCSSQASLCGTLASEQRTMTLTRLSSAASGRADTCHPRTLAHELKAGYKSRQPRRLPTGTCGRLTKKLRVVRNFRHRRVDFRGSERKGECPRFEQVLQSGLIRRYYSTKFTSRKIRSERSADDGRAKKQGRGVITTVQTLSCRSSRSLVRKRIWNG